MNKTFVIGLVFMLSLAISTVSLQAQDDSAEQSRDRLSIEQADKDGPAAKGLTLEKKSSPRLPNGFGKLLLEDKQKEEIRRIQGEYNELINFLRLRIELLTTERNTKIDAVLTPEQLEKVKRPAKKPARNATETSAE